MATATPPVSDPQETVALATEKRRNLPAFLALMLVLGILLVLAALIFSPFLGPIVVALVFTTVSQPLFSRIVRLLGEKRRGLAAALTCGAIIVLVILPLAWIGWSIVEQAPEGARFVKRSLHDGMVWVEGKNWEWFQRSKQNETFRNYWDRIRASLEEKKQPGPGDPPPPKQPETAPPPAEPGGKETPPTEGGGKTGEFPRIGFDLVGKTTQGLAWFLANALEIILKFFLMIFILFYFLKDGTQILRSLNRAVPLDKKYQEKTVETFRQVTRSIIRGSVGTALVQGVIATLALLPLKYFGHKQDDVANPVPGGEGGGGEIPAIFLGVLVALTSLIPPVGTGLIMVPLTVIIFLTKGWGWGIYLVVVSLIIGSLDNIVRPFLVGQGIRMHPIWLLLSILGGLSMFGGMGLLYGPLVLVLLATFFGIFVREEEKEAASAPVPAQVIVTAPPNPESGNGGKR